MRDVELDAILVRPLKAMHANWPRSDRSQPDPRQASRIAEHA
jgi:hypothetical protein